VPATDVNEEFAEKLCAKRRVMRYTQKEVGELVGVTKSYICQIERRIKTASVGTKLRIMRKLNMY